MKLSYSVIISSIVAVSSVMSAPAAVVDNISSSPSIVPEVTITRDPMSGATAIASITITGHEENNNEEGFKAQKLSTSGSEKIVISVASVALPIALMSAFALA